MIAAGQGERYGELSEDTETDPRYRGAVAALKNLVLSHQDEQFLMHNLGLDSRSARAAKNVNRESSYARAVKLHGRYLQSSSSKTPKDSVFINVWEGAIGELHEQMCDWWLRKGRLVAGLPQFTPPPEIYRLEMDEDQLFYFSVFLDLSPVKVSRAA